MNEPNLTRREFLAGAAALSALPSLGSATTGEDDFRSRWERTPDRVWPGPAYWSNPLQDWRIAGGRLECLRPAPGRNLQVLTRELADWPGDLRMTVRLGSLDGGPLGRAKGSAGFDVGVKGPLGDYRNALVHGSGLHVGLRMDGELFLGDGPKGRSGPVELEIDAVELRLACEPAGEVYRATLTTVEPATGRVLGKVERDDLPPAYLVGNLALAANFPRTANAEGTPPGRFWFDAWTITGSKVQAHPDRAFGPILFSQYTLHGGILKMTAQLPPVGEADERTVRLQVEREGGWRTIADSAIDPLTCTAHFRVEGWDDARDVPVRLAYTLRDADGRSTEDHWTGLVRRDPKDRGMLTVADISCNAHYAFPNEACVASMATLDPDLIAFTGDQYYESTGGFGVDRRSVEFAVLDMLRKWFQHGWTWRELMKDRPVVSIPDDHDIYHGNLWGEGGAAAPGTGSDAEAKGGYKMMPKFVNAVHRVQTAHHPDSPAKPGKQGITGYFGPLTYGGVSFAILADRQYKTGPDGETPPTTSGRADHVIDPNFDPASADLPGLDLLGDDQLTFLEAWADDWRGAEMKAAISQTIFTAMATHHGQPDGFLVADYDTNAWPQAARDAAVKALRRAFAFHLAGDQHLPAVVHYGVEDHRDGVVAFASPAVNNLYPRWFWPESPGENRPADAPEYLGDFRDSFDHPMTVLACANPKRERRRAVLDAETDKSAGFGVVRFDTKARTITVECWPLLADPSTPGTQFPGWPVTVSQLDSGTGSARASLPELTIRGVERPVVRVIDESTGEIVYTLRLSGSTWRPFARVEGPHSVVVLDPESGRSREWGGIEARAGNDESMELML